MTLYIWILSALSLFGNLGQKKTQAKICKGYGEGWKGRVLNYNSDILENAERLRLENAENFSLVAMDKEFHAMLDKHVPKFSVEESIKLPKLKRLGTPTVTAPELPKLKKIEKSESDITASL